MRRAIWSQSSAGHTLGIRARDALRRRTAVLPAAAAAAALTAPRAPKFALPGELGGSLFEWNSRLGADPAMRARWDSILRGDGQVVVTGQQPALLGGPLYTIYKLASAISLAGWLERTTGRPTLAIFWLVGDDSDFGEVSGGWCARGDGRLVSVRDDATPPSGTCIGGLDARRQSLALERLAALLPPASASRLAAATAPVVAAARDWGEFQAALLHRLLPGRSFLCLDGGSEPVLRAAQPFLRSRVWESVLPRLLEEGAVDAIAHGAEPAFEPDVGLRARFIVRDGRREPLVGVPERSDLLAPNAVLRPVLQDWLLPNVATVGGPSEMRYRAQLGPVYAVAEVAEPISWPRAQLVLLPAAVASAMGASETERAVGDPDAFVASRITADAESPLLEEIERFRAARNEEWLRLAEQLAAVDPSLVQLAESARGKADYQTQRLREGLESKLRQRALRRTPWLANWRDLVRPRERGQERVLSCVTPWSWGADGFADALLQTADEDLARRLADGSNATAILSLETNPEE